MIQACPSCKQPVQILEEFVGKKVRCAHCQSVFKVGRIETIPTAPAAFYRSGSVATTSSNPIPSQSASSAPPPAEETETDRLDVEWRTVSTQAALRRGANFLTASGFAFGVAGLGIQVFNLCLISLQRNPPPVEGPYYLGMIVGFVCMLLFVAIPVVFLFMAASHLRRARSRGLVTTGAVLGIILACFGILALFAQVLNILTVNQLYGDHRGTALAFIVLQSVLLLFSVALGFFACIWTLLLLGRQEIKEAFGSWAPRRKRPLPDYEDGR